MDWCYTSQRTISIIFTVATIAGEMAWTAILRVSPRRTTSVPVGSLRVPLLLTLRSRIEALFSAHTLKLILVYIQVAANVSKNGIGPKISRTFTVHQYPFREAFRPLFAHLQESKIIFKKPLNLFPIFSGNKLSFETKKMSDFLFLL